MSVVILADKGGVAGLTVTNVFDFVINKLFPFAFWLLLMFNWRVLNNESVGNSFIDFFKTKSWI